MYRGCFSKLKMYDKTEYKNRKIGKRYGSKGMFYETQGANATPKVKISQLNKCKVKVYEIHLLLDVVVLEARKPR